MKIDDLVARAARYDKNLAKDIDEYLRGRQYGLVYEASKPEWVRLWNKPVAVGDFVNVLPPRGTMEDTSSEEDSADVAWLVTAIEDGTATLVIPRSAERREAKVSDLVAIARFDQPIYAGLRETGRVERGGGKPYQVVINGENFHALQALMYCYEGKVDCIYIDPPYNTGAKDWKYNNNYVDGSDVYRHSKWLTFMEDRLRLAKKLLNPRDSVLICTIDEKEVNRLGLLLEKLFPSSNIQMVSIGINPAAVARDNEFGRSDEYAFFVMQGTGPVKLTLGTGWITTKGRTHLGHARKDLFRRSGSNSARHHSPGCFYPIYINEHRIVSIGSPVPPGTDRHDCIENNGLTAVFPIRQNGTEGVWMGGVDTAQSLLGQGYLWIGNYAGENTPIYYYARGERAKIESGIYPLLGKDANGVAILGTNEDQSFQAVPGTQWHMPGHDSTQYGSRLLLSFLGDQKRFTYPKSLYAVEDTLRFFVAGKPDALVVDFFAGSGTTAHAVMRLNHQDGGRRRCICITNNEVSADEQTALTARNLRQGDPEWEAHGICEYVTKPRITAAITGRTPDGEPISGDYGIKTERYVLDEDDVTIPKKRLQKSRRFYLRTRDGYVIDDKDVLVSKNQVERGKKIYMKRKVQDDSVPDPFPMADGFEENAVFFDLTYLEPTAVDADLAFDDIAPLLWMRAGCRGPIITHSDDYVLGETYAVLFSYDRVRAFVSAVRDHDAIRHVFIVTDIDSQYRSMRREFRGYDVVRLYQSYLRSFEINTEA